ncbi:16S rRNA (guanine(1405)-N(7))-methyltransferase RmtG, partial [Klebsiella aerogenes]
NVGMAVHYAAWMRDQLPEKWRIERTVETDNELYYVLKEKQDGEAVRGGDSHRESE